MTDTIQYQDYFQLIQKVSWQYSQTYQLEITDFMSLGNEVFMKALQTWNRVANFGGWLKRLLIQKFSNFVRDHFNKETHSLEKIEEIAELEGNNRCPAAVTEITPYSILNCKDALLNLSPKAKEMIVIATDPKFAKDSVLHKEGNTLTLAKKHLRKNGWGIRLIDSCIKEIRETLGDL